MIWILSDPSILPVQTISHGIKSPFQKIIYHLYCSCPMIHVTHLTLYDCDISSRGSIIFHEKGLGIEGRGLGVKVVMKNGCRGWVSVKNLDNVLSIFT